MARQSDPSLIVSDRDCFLLAHVARARACWNVLMFFIHCRSLKYCFFGLAVLVGIVKAMQLTRGWLIFSTIEMARQKTLSTDADIRSAEDASELFRTPGRFY
ncbi:unnamed protein product [Polarella glacialis]|uniref:Uncharacterized protein n=1 Tax=Polarella glacialis TaxID=89957 RepID=A0A813HEA0_POLGL|nr:unnamed protein product [Polarella glacialis]